MQMHEIHGPIKGYVVLDVAESAAEACRGRVRRVAINLAHVVAIELRDTLPITAEFRLDEAMFDGTRSLFCVVPRVQPEPGEPHPDETARFLAFLNTVGYVADTGR